MIRNILRRLLPGLLILILFQTVVFCIVQIILPGDFVSHLALTMSTSESRELRQTLSGDERQHDPKSLSLYYDGQYKGWETFSHPSLLLIPLKLCLFD